VSEPQTNSVFDLPPDDAEEARLDAVADAEIDAGRGVGHERVRDWVMQRAKGTKIAPPTA
jgi:predicted transcriptional regulator